MMKKTVILTSINPPTPAVTQFAALPDWDVLVVGDVKTPPRLALPGGNAMFPSKCKKRCRLKSFSICPGIIMPAR